MKPTGKKIWVARQHHDWQREGSSTGYFSPAMEPYTDKGKTLILGHQAHMDEKIHDNELVEDDTDRYDLLSQIVQLEYGIDAESKIRYCDQAIELAQKLDIQPAIPYHEKGDKGHQGTPC